MLEESVPEVNLDDVDSTVLSEALQKLGYQSTESRFNNALREALVRAKGDLTLASELVISEIRHDEDMLWHLIEADSQYLVRRRLKSFAHAQNIPTRYKIKEPNKPGNAIAAAAKAVQETILARYIPEFNKTLAECDKGELVALSQRRRKESRLQAIESVFFDNMAANMPDVGLVGEHITEKLAAKLEKEAGEKL